MTHGLITLRADTLLTVDTDQQISGNKEFTGSLQAVTKDASDSSKNVATTEYVTTAISNIDALPDQTNKSGNVLTTNGTVASWVDLNLDSKQNALTETQVAAVDSGITTDRVSKYDNYESEKANKADTLAGYGITDAFTKDEIASKISSVYKYKGSVETVDDLPTENLTEGDVYNVKSTGDNYAWVAPVGDVAGFWDKLAGDIDLSAYATLKDPEFTGTPKATTADVGDNTTRIATTAFVKTAIDNVDAIPDQTGNNGKLLTTDGTTATWTDAVKITLRNWEQNDVFRN